MQRKPGFPVANCTIKMPECPLVPEPLPTYHDDDVEHRRLQLINFGHSQWGFNNWSWSVTKQDLDFVDFTNGKFCAGVAAFVNITVKSLDIHRDNVGYATTVATTKGYAVYKSRKCAVTNALRETLMSFGGSVAIELNEMLELQRSDVGAPVNVSEPCENNQNVANRASEPKNSPHCRAHRKDAGEAPPSCALRSPHLPPPQAQPPQPPPAVKNAPVVKPPPGAVPPGPVPLCTNRPPAPAAVRPPAPRPNSNEGTKNTEDPSEEARAERKRRQRLAQEEFRLKQLMKHYPDEKHELNKTSCSSFDKLLMDIPTQEIVIEATGDETKRKSPSGDGHIAKRRTGSVTKLDIMKD